jgi:hypothetical protein
MKGKGPFGAEDQNDFAQSLRKELVRLGVVKSVTEGEDAADMVATINIDHASFNGDWVEYKLDLTMSITGGKLPYQQRYHVVSTEKDSIWQKMNTNGAEGREKLAHLMLERLIPDIERYALAMTRP